MPTPSLTPSSVVVPSGGTADVSVAWTLAPGIPATPDITGTLSLLVNGAPVTIPVVHQGSPGTPGEVAPRLVLSDPQPGDVLVSCDVAAVALVNQQTIRLS